MLALIDLRAFARIADIESVSGAARSLKMPKSSVSRSLAWLEEAVGAVLVERSTRHLRLTDAGLLFRQHVLRILDDIGEAKNAMGGLVGRPRGDLKIGAPFTFAAGPLALMLPAFLERYPEVRVVLTVDNRSVDLMREEIDVAIRIGQMQNSELIARRLTTFPLWPCASPAYLARHAPIETPADLAGHTLFAHADRRETWAFRTSVGAVRDFVFTPSAVVPEPDVVKTMLIQGAGIGLLPDFHSLSANVRVFIDALTNHFQKKLTGDDMPAPAVRSSSSSSS